MKRHEAAACSGCSFRQSWLLHNVRHQGDFYRYCTSCVLKVHRGSFCSNCFDVFEGPPPNDYVKCSKCPSKCASISHLSCLGSETPSRFVCAICSNPNFLFFNPVPNGKEGKTSDGQTAAPTGRPVIDLTAAKVLLAAAKIAAQSMSRAASAARQDAEKKVREAAFARKRAREALERAASIKSKHKQTKLLLEAEQKKKLKVNSAVAAAVAMQKRVQNCFASGTINNPSLGEREKHVAATVASSLMQKSPKNGEVRGLSTSVPGVQSLPTSILKDDNGKNRPLLETSAEDKGRLKGFPESGMSSHVVKLNQESSLSKANSGVMFTGSQSTASLLS
ncbi:hypothetical protein H6P81_004460 [Aristolochia fimbriata]|uniref:Uncharacterized protein n=1 Tax=Aristolochia fimbriata TaxID=158543 RepID=A0AAV7FFF8_ARIFI|nr:hypothetical protein H6P81_004460 [Aristolochia fimbriata]